MPADLARRADPAKIRSLAVPVRLAPRPVRFAGPALSARVLAGVAACASVGAAFAAIAVARAKPHRAVAGAGALLGDVLELRVPHTQGPIALDGDMDDPGWLRGCARTGAFTDKGGETARPYSDARFVYGDGVLYVGLYAADEDIHARQTGLDSPVWTDDSFHLVFSDGDTERSFDLSPAGALADGARRVGATNAEGAHPFDFSWNSGAHVSHEMDGTPNKPDDNDEEWLIEMAVPLDALGLRGDKGERIGVAVHRCDTFKSGVRSCGAWGEPHEPSAPGERRAGRGVLVFD